jgi:ABC-type antimicrobial peptide transport system permease subunit
VLSVKVDRSNFNPRASPGRGLPVARIEQFVASHPLIQDFAFVTMPIEYQVQQLFKASVVNVGHLAEDVQNVRGVSPSIFTSSFDGFTLISDYDGLRGSTNPWETVAYRLYGREGSSGVILGSSLNADLGYQHTGVNASVLLKLYTTLPAPVALATVSASNTLDSVTTQSSYLRRLHIESFLSLAPLFSFSGYPSGSSLDTLLSLSTFAKLCSEAPNSTVSAVEDLLMEYVLFKTPDNTTDDQYDQLKRDLSAVMDGSSVSTIYELDDTRDTTVSLQTSSSLINFFFLFTVIIALLICFFSLVSSMYTNIHEQKKEIGVMLALGMSKSRLYRMYIWEAICVVLSSSMLGIIIGVIVSYTVTLQQVLFTQLPVPYAFPWIITVAVILLSFLFGLLAAVFPLRSILSNSPVAILRT